MICYTPLALHSTVKCFEWNVLSLSAARYGGPAFGNSPLGVYTQENQHHHRILIPRPTGQPTWLSQIASNAFLVLSKSPVLTDALGTATPISPIHTHRSLFAPSSSSVSPGPQAAPFDHPVAELIDARHVVLGTEFVCRVYAPAYQIRLRSLSEEWK